MVFLVLLAVPVLLALAGWVLTKQVSGKEVACMVGVGVVVAAVSAIFVSCANTHDVEVWNGRVTSKAQETVSCSHSYPCNCHEVCSGGKNPSCSTVCDTCYEHSHDYDWAVYTSTGEEIDIDRIDSQGVNEPPRWTAVRIGEPVSTTHSYTNYIKASPDSLFRHQGIKDKYQGHIPAYPGNIYDYYRLNRLVLAGAVVGDSGAWNSQLSELNADLGAAKQVNIIVVLTNEPPEYFYALEESWIGGKKNDVILVVGLNGDKSPAWAEVMAWTTNQLFKVKLRDDIMDEKAIGVENVITALRTNITKYHQRKPMSDFEYLKSAITPTATQWAVSLMIVFLISLGMLIYFYMEDPFEYRFGSFGRGRFRRRAYW
jgi:hypothetical protein